MKPTKMSWAQSVGFNPNESSPERARADCGEKKLPFNRKKPPSEPEPGRISPPLRGLCITSAAVQELQKRSLVDFQHKTVC